MDMVQTLPTTSLILYLPTVYIFSFFFFLINMSVTFTHKRFPMSDGCIFFPYVYFYSGLLWWAKLGRDENRAWGISLFAWYIGGAGASESIAIAIHGVLKYLPCLMYKFYPRF